MRIEGVEGNVFCYKVHSYSEKEKDYVVNLKDWTCECNHFKYNVSTFLRAGWDRAACTCKHLDLAITKFAFRMLDIMRDMEDEKNAIEEEEADEAVAKASQKNPDETCFYQEEEGHAGVQQVKEGLPFG